MSEPVPGRLGLLRLLPGGGRWLTAGVVALHLVVAVIPTAVAAIAGALVAMLRTGAETGRILSVVVLLCGVGLLSESALALQGIAGTVLARRIDGRLRRDVRATTIGRVGFEELESARFQDDVDRACDYGQDFGRMRSPGTAAVGQVTAGFRVGSGLLAAALLATFSIPLALVVTVFALVVRVRVRRRHTSAVGESDAAAGDRRRLAYWTDLAALGATKEVRLFGLTPWLLVRRKAMAFRSGGPQWRRAIRVARQEWPDAILLALGAAAVLGVPAAAAYAGRLAPDGMLRSMLAGAAVFAASSMGPEAFDIEFGRGTFQAVERFRSRYRTAPLSTPHAAPSIPERPPLVQFEDVVFRYPGRSGRPVLDGLNLTMRPGERLAMVGPNGAGKTTFVKLLTGLYRPTAGRIRVAGVDLTEIDPAWWRGVVAVVFQDFVRYPATLAENVALGAPERHADPQTVREALRRAGADHHVAGLPDGVLTLVWKGGTGGIELSGGQWQGIAIARALFAAMSGRRVLVFDEPTASLDVATEAAFHERVIAALGESATTLLISHRLSTVRPASRVVLLDAGRIAEDGSHDELMALGGHYCRLFTLQAARFTQGAVPE